MGGAFIGIFQTGTTEYTKENEPSAAVSSSAAYRPNVTSLISPLLPTPYASSTSRVLLKSDGAVYEITAAEDIITTDGTVRAEKGEVVDTLTTGEDGTADFQWLRPRLP